MKSKILFAALLFSANLSFSQTINCDEIKKQNQILQDRIKQYGIDLSNPEIKVSSYSSDISVNYIKCLGDSKSQTVTLYFNMINLSLPNQTLYLLGSITDKNYQYINTQAFDEIGTGFPATKAALGSEKSNPYSSVFERGDFLHSPLMTGSFPVLGSITFANVLPSTKVLKKVVISMNNKNQSGTDEGDRNKGITEFSNVKISWK